MPPMLKALAAVRGGLALGMQIATGVLTSAITCASSSRRCRCLPKVSPGQRERERYGGGCCRTLKRRRRCVDGAECRAQAVVPFPLAQHSTAHELPRRKVCDFRQLPVHAFLFCTQHPLSPSSKRVRGARTRSRAAGRCLFRTRLWQRVQGSRTTTSQRRSRGR